MGHVTWSRWNDADKTLFLAAALFLFFLCLHLAYPGNVLADGLLFVAEAALVGGIADWFAVTALFRKPLGFPYHTAILPRRRDAFVQASVVMVQKEFFSRRKIFRHLGKLHLMPMIMDWLDKPATKNMLLRRLMGYSREFLARQDKAAQAALLAGQVREALDKVEPESIMEGCASYLRRSGRDREILARFAGYAYEYAERPETLRSIEAMLEEYAKSRAKSPAAILMAGIAQFFDLVNFEEAALLMQKQLLSMIDELRKPDSPLQQEILSLFHEKVRELGREPDFKQLAKELLADIGAQLPLEEAIKRALERMEEDFAAEESLKGDEEPHIVGSKLSELFSTEYDRGVSLLRCDEELRKGVEKFLYDLIARSALHAQSLIGVVVSNVLRRLTDEQLNRLVYDKVEPDLLWIRMNGSIVGSVIGIFLFGLLRIAG